MVEDSQGGEIVVQMREGPEGKAGARVTRYEDIFRAFSWIVFMLLGIGQRVRQYIRSCAASNIFRACALTTVNCSDMKKTEQNQCLAPKRNIF
jgi:hypothetical protein